MLSHKFECPLAPHSLFLPLLAAAWCYGQHQAATIKNAMPTAGTAATTATAIRTTATKTLNKMR